MRGLIKLAWLPIMATTLSGMALTINTAGASGATFVGGGWQVNSAPAVVLTGTLPLISAFPAFTGFGWTGVAGEWIGQTVTDGNFLNPTCGSVAPTATCGTLPGTFIYSLSWTSVAGGSFTINGFTGDNGIACGE